MYGVYTYIYHKHQPNIGKYTILGSYVLRQSLHWWEFSLGDPRIAETLPRFARSSTSLPKTSELIPKIMLWKR